MNMQKKIVYFVTFFIILIVVPYAAIKYYFKYEDGLYPSLKDYQEYVTLDKKYTVKVMDTQKFGDEEVLTLKVYLVDNDTEEATYIGTTDYSTYGENEVTFSENLDNTYEITVLFKTTEGTERIVVDCNEKKNKDSILYKLPI